VLTEEIDHTAAADDLAALERNKDLFSHVELDTVARQLGHLRGIEMAIGLLGHEFLLPTKALDQSGDLEGPLGGLLFYEDMLRHLDLLGKKIAFRI